MSWIAEYDTQGREFPTCVHVTKTTGTMTNGATYVPIEDGRAMRAENAKLRELAKEATKVAHVLCGEYAAPCSSCAVDRCDTGCKLDWIDELAYELGIEDT